MRLSTLWFSGAKKNDFALQAKNDPQHLPCLPDSADDERLAEAFLLLPRSISLRILLVAFVHCLAFGAEILRILHVKQQRKVVTFWLPLHSDAMIRLLEAYSSRYGWSTTSYRCAIISAWLRPIVQPSPRHLGLHFSLPCCFTLLISLPQCEGHGCWSLFFPRSLAQVILPRFQSNWSRLWQRRDSLGIPAVLTSADDESC